MAQMERLRFASLMLSERAANFRMADKAEVKDEMRVIH
jgi:hypothetical protein